MFGILIDSTYTAGTGAGPYLFDSRGDALAAIQNGWSQFSSAWKRRHLRVVGPA